MVAYLAQLDETDVTTAATASHVAWGGPRSTAEYVTHVKQCLLRSDGHAQLAGLKQDDELVCTLERRRVTLTSPHGPLPTLGIGRVFTPKKHRSQGHAQALIEHVMAEARDADMRTFLLFADGEPKIYEKLGFEKLSHVMWTARTSALPSLPGRLEPTADIPRLVEIFEKSWRPSWLHMHRSAAHWRYASWRHQAGDAFLIGDNDYMIAKPVGKTLWIDDVATTETTRDALWGSLRLLASAVGADTVSGWLRPEHGGGPFVAAGRKSCIPMIATHVSLDSVRTHFASLDRV